MRPDVHQRIGSVTKTFTAALLMQLVGEGKLSLDDTIGKYIGGVPNGDTITLRQVAGMTSGVASYTKNPAFVEGPVRAPQAHLEAARGDEASASRTRRTSRPEPSSNTRTPTSSCSGW